MKTLLWSTFAVGLILAAADLLTITLGVLLVIFVGILFGIFLNAVTRGVSRVTPLAYRWSYVVVVAVLVAVVIGGVLWLDARIGEHVAQLSDRLQAAFTNLVERHERFRSRHGLVPSASDVRSVLSDGENVRTGLKTSVRWIGWAVTGTVVTFFVGVYVATHPICTQVGW